MQYNPQDLVEYEPVEEGDYGFVVVNAEDTTSRNGNEMLSLTLQVDVQGREKPITVFDQLVNTPAALWVLKAFCQSVTPFIDFEAGQLQAANCIGAAGVSHLILGDETPKGRRFMQVGHYVRRKGGSDEPSAVNPTPASPQEQTPPDAPDASDGDDSAPF